MAHMYTTHRGKDKRRDANKSIDVSAGSNAKTKKAIDPMEGLFKKQ